MFVRIQDTVIATSTISGIVCPKDSKVVTVVFTDLNRPRLEFTYQYPKTAQKDFDRIANELAAYNDNH